MANPYREGKSWSIRAQYKHQEIYQSGFASPAAAKRYVEQRKADIDKFGRPAKLGPDKTVLAVALSDYGLERLPYLKGARQDAQRINNYLRACKLPVIKLTPLTVPIEELLGDEAATIDGCQKSKVIPKIRYWTVALVDETERHICNSLKEHRASQEKAAALVNRERARLARMRVGDVCTYHINWVINAMKDAGSEAATIDLERAELRRFYNHARKAWHWSAYSDESGQ
jgi:hypothetical protein